MRKADVAPEVANNLPELNVEWYWDHWSRSDYLPVPESEPVSKCVDPCEDNSIRVSAIICEVNNNYILDNKEYKAAVLKLQALERAQQFAESQAPSQTSGAGLLGVQQSPRVTVEEIEDKDCPRRSWGVLTHHMERRRRLGHTRWQGGVALRVYGLGM
jgi:hypothetical protein